MTLPSTRPPAKQPVLWVCTGVAVSYVVVASVFLLAGDGPALRDVLLLAGGVLAVAALAVHAVISERTLRAHEATLHHHQSVAREQAVALECVAEQVEAFAQGAPAAPPLPELNPSGRPAALAHRVAAVLDRLRDDRQGRQDAVHAAVVALARKAQTSAHRLQEEATRMVQRHPSDPDILHTSMRVDHAAAQQARHAQTLAALCGEWPGQQWHEPLPLADVVRGAAGRITAYQRVEISGDPGVAVSPRVVEPLIHLIAELLANATQSSPPTTNVLVTLRHVQRGAVVEIDDCGVGLDDRRLEQAREIASGRRQVGLSDLGEIPQTGLPVVGAYVRRYGFRVDLTESVYGGVRAITLVPSELTETIPPGGSATVSEHALTRKPPPRAVEPPRREEREPQAVRPTEEPHSLPRRRSRRGEAPQLADSDVEWPAPSGTRAAQRTQHAPATQTAEQAGQWMGAFLRSSPEGPRSAVRTDSAADVDNTPEE